MIQTSFNKDEEVVHSQTDHFRVTLQNNQWQIRYESPASYADGFFVFGSDGRNIYEIRYALRHRSTNLNYRLQAINREIDMSDIPITKEFKSVDEGSHSGMITPGLYPYDLLIGKTVWFAFASGYYLNNTTNVSRMPAFWFDIRYDPVAFAFESEIETFQKWPHLPMKAKFTRLGRNSLPKDIFLIPELNYPDNPMMSQRLKSKVRILDIVKGKHLASEYACLLHTNVGGATFPLQFELRHYRFPEAPHSLYSLLTSQITNMVLQENMPPLGKPPIRGKILGMQDYRFRDRTSGGTMNYLYYNITNKTWPAMDDPHVQLYYEERKMKEQEAKWNSLGRWAGLLMILAVIAIPVWGWWKEKRKAR